MRTAASSTHRGALKDGVTGFPRPSHDAAAMAEGLFTVISDTRWA